MAHRLAFLAVLIALPVTVSAQTAPAPAVLPGESWTYLQTNEVGTNWRQTHQELTVEHANSASIAIAVKEAGSTMPPKEELTGADWSRVRSVNGAGTVVNRPLAFPISVGKSWTVDYTENNPNRQHLSEHYRTPYKAVGWEDVTVPAGTFRALKIEADGEWTAVTAPNSTSVAAGRTDQFGATGLTNVTRAPSITASGRTYKAFWYVPGVKRWVKSVEEYYGPNGIRNASYKAELEAFHTAG